MDIKEALQEAIDDYSSGDLDSAESKFLNITKEHPDDPNAHNLLGVVLGARGKFDDAIKHLEKAIDVKSDVAPFHYNLAQIYKQQYRVDEALESCQKALSLNDNYFPAMKDSVILFRHQGKYEDAGKMGLRAVESHPNNPFAHNTLGEVYENIGKFDEAEKCYLKAIELSPELYQPYTNLGNINHNLGQMEKSKELYEKSLSLNPNQPIIEHALASLNGDTPEKPHDDFVVSLFNRYAETFDDHMLSLGYKVPDAIFNAVKKLKGDDVKGLKIIDLGCGTGKCGRLFSSHTKLLIGVDLAPKMLEQAAKQNVYDELILSDVVDIFVERDTKYDLIISADTFIYVGALENVFKEAADALYDGGMLAFSIEEEGGEGFSLATTSRYKHSKKYIENLAQENGLSLVHDEEIGIRMQIDKPIPGRVILLEKK